MGIRIVLAIAACYACALLAYVACRIRRRTLGGVVASLLGIGGVLAAMIVPADAPLVRCMLAILASINLCRVYSFWRERIDAPIGSYLRFLSFALFRPNLIYTDPSPRRPKRVGREILRLLLAIAVMVPAWWIPGMIIPTPPVENSWLLNHLIVLAAFIVLMGAVGEALLAIWRLQGLPVRRPVNDNILLSRTPADFWRRWSWPIHGWLVRYVYHFNGGRRNHVRATLLVFLISGVGHELLFFAALGRATGHQMLFFLLNAPAVLASPALERFGQRHGAVGEALIRTATILFLVAASALMFISFHYVTPIYAKRIGLMW
jgi:hypothetical protein